MLTQEGIWGAVECLAELHGYSLSGLARQAGLDPTTFNRSKRTGPEGRPRWPSTESLALILEVTGTSLTEFAAMVEKAGPRSSAFVQKKKKR